jgi:hypothetical protein
VLPVPKRPLEDIPQHFTDALSSTAHVCMSPAEMATAVRPVPKLIVDVAATVDPALLPILLVVP